MRYLPQTSGTTSASFNESARPALDKLPEPLADKLLERDRIMAQRSAAQGLVNDLGTEQATEAAQQADDETAAKAARAGKAIPPAVAVPKLEAARASAARALTAQQAAFVDIDAECEDVASKLHWATLEEVAGERAMIRASIAAKAAELADEVAAAVDKFAVSDWMRYAVYNRSIMTWPTEVLDLERYGLSRLNTTPVNVRDVIIAAATTLLDEPTE
jgi:hypothetical protein